MKTWKQKIKEYLTPGLIITIGSLIVTGIAFLFSAVVDNNKIQLENKQLMFETVEQRVKTKEHINTPYNPVNAYKQSVKLTEQAIKLDSSYALMDKIFQQNIVHDSIKKEDKERVNKSREARDSVNRLILQKLEKLDSVK